jgi:aryl-alcohol dehydrogenase-like predicted oxidoreductase
MWTLPAPILIAVPGSEFIAPESQSFVIAKPRPFLSANRLTTNSDICADAIDRKAVTPDYSVAPLINGCWQLAEGHGGNSLNVKTLFSNLNERVEAGFTTFDCADIYTGVEELLGEFLRQFNLQHQAEIHTKYVPNLNSLATVDPASVRRGIHRSLKRLGLERLDLVQFHWWDYAVPGYLEAFAELEELRLAGDIRCLGVTNFDRHHLSELIDTQIPVSAIQLQYSLLDRRPEKGMADLCATNNVAMFCYGGLAGGLISKRYLGQEEPKAANRSQAKYLLMIREAGGWQAFQGLLAALDEVASVTGLSISAVALRWMLDQPAVTAVIVGMGSRDHLAEHISLFETKLPADSHQLINAALSRLQIPGGDVFGLERGTGGSHSANMKMNLNTGVNQ